MSRQNVLLCIFVVLIQWQPWSTVAAGLVPPRGYSLAFTGRIVRGTQQYVCTGGTWTKTGSSADMVSPNGAKLGTYWSTNNKGSLTYFWTIINSAGDSGESGQATSGLQATAVETSQVSPTSITQYLSIVKVHRGSGDADRVAFVSLTSTSGGLPPSKALCSSNGASSGVPFTGVFRFYTQDLEPPPVPITLSVKGGTFVQSVFVQGKMHYTFSKGKWSYQGVLATITDVAGGTVLGQFGTVNQDKYGNKVESKTVFKFKNPNGFWLEALLCAKPVQVSKTSCPWQLFRITNSGGYVTPLGKFTYLRLASTMGGQPPKIAARTDGITYGSTFTGQCNMYI